MDKKLQQALEKLSASFEQEIPGKLREVELAFEEVNLKNWKNNNEEKLFAQLHQLAGTAGTMGFEELGDSASQLALRVSLAVQQQPPNQVIWNQIGNDIKKLVAHNGQEPLIRDDKVKEIRPQLSKKLVYIVDDDPTITEVIATALSANGYLTQEFSETDSFIEKCRTGSIPDLVFMDMDFPDSFLAGGEAIAKLRCDLHSNLLTIFVSQHDSMDARLAAFRAGASRYLLKPIQIQQLINLADDLCKNSGAQPYKVLVVDDDKYTLAAYVASLEAIGMEAIGLTNPLEVLDEIRRFVPDVLLMDVYMPEASGPEIAAVIREDESLAWLPILFLSVETDPSKHALALAHGGDDFLVKPVQPAYLQEAVKARAWRARRNRQLWKIE